MRACQSLPVPQRPMIDGYAKRWSIEPGFRDCKDPRFGMGMSQVRLQLHQAA